MASETVQRSWQDVVVAMGSISAVISNSEMDTDAVHLARMFVYWQLLSLMCAVWLFYVARHLRPGLIRCLACLPVAAVVLNATPHLLDRCRMPVIFIPHMTAMSISAFKVAAFAIGRGPLALEDCYWCKSLVQFMMVLSLPIIPTAALKPGKVPPNLPSKPSSSSGNHNSITTLPLPPPTSPTTIPEYLYALFWQWTFIAVAVQVSLQLWLPDIIRHWFYTLCLVLSLQHIWDFYGLVAALWFGIEPSRSFHKPWMAPTLAEWWARRWNLPVTHMLRVLVYDPIIEGRLVPTPKLKTNTVTAPAKPSVPKPWFVSPSNANTGRDGSDINQAAAASSTTGAAVAQASTSTSRTASDASSTSSTAHDSVSSFNVRDNNSSFDTANSKLHNSKTANITAVGTRSTVLCDGPGGAKAAQHVAHSASGEVTPASQGRVKNSSLLRRYVALQASFVVSGAWHTLIFYYATGRLIPHWFAFFSVQAPVLVLESIVLALAKKQGVRLPHAVAVVLTNYVLIAVGSPLFFAPVDWSGLSQAFFDNVVGSIPGSEWDRLCRA